MRSTSVPGYKEFYPGMDESYESLVAKIPSDMVLAVFIAINSELNSKEDKLYTQGRIFNIVRSRFSAEQNQYLYDRFELFSSKPGGYQGIMFGRRYLIALIVKELNNFRLVEDYQDQPEHEFNLFKAYLKVIDEENQKDHLVINFKALKKDTDPNKAYKLLWMPLLRQYEFNNRPEIIFELYRSWLLLSYSLTNYRSYLKEYLLANKLKSAGALLASLQQISVGGAGEDLEGAFKKLHYIKPLPAVDQTHLQAQTINAHIGQPISLSDIKKQPLYLKDGRGYMVIDRDIYQKKVYNGLFFDLIKSTGLQDSLAFNQYSVNVSNFMETNLLQPILRKLDAGHADVLHFDDGTQGVPDGYLRIGNTVFLFEYKAYVFPETLSSEPNFDLFKAYIDERFVKKGKRPKGITQLKAQMVQMAGKEFPFDKGTSTDPTRIKIYPIILHQDFQFSLPGINRYLDDLFRVEIKKSGVKFQVMPVVMVNLEKLLDIIICGEDILGFEKLLTTYYKHSFNHHILFQKSGNSAHFLKWNMSFDELYVTQLSRKLTAVNDLGMYIKDILEASGVSMDEMNAEL